MVDATPSNAGAQFKSAQRLQANGEFNRAIELYNKLLAIDPDVPEVLNNLGNALRDVGRLDDAVAIYRRALKIKPNFSAAYNNLGLAQGRMGSFGDALESYRHAVSVNPDFADAYNNEGNALVNLGRTGEAISSYRKAIALRTGFVEAQTNLGNALRDLGHLEEAFEWQKRACECNPRIPETYYNCGNVLLDLLRLDEAHDAYSRALKLRENYPRALVALARVMRLKAQFAEAEEACQRALRIEPKFAEALSFLGELKTDAGDFDDALELFGQAIERDPSLVAAWCGIARCRQIGPEDVQWRDAAQRLLSQSLPIRDEIALQYAVGKALNDCGEWEQAFVHYRRANELTRKCAARYDQAAFASEVKCVIDRYNRREITRLSAFGVESERPVFIVGMPRSGTTLAEQILASHPCVFGAGELSFWGEAAAKLTAKQAQSITGDEVARFSMQYLMQIEKLSPDAWRVVDKMPLNYLNLGLIHAALPRARIILMSRNAPDVCLSIYFQNFSVAHGYATDLNDLVHFYQQSIKVINYWRSALPDGILMEVPYENLVQDPEFWSRKMVEFIGLKWDARCLDFHKTRRMVITPSRWQVRQQASSDSIGRWRRYEQFVAPLMALVTDLGGTGCESGGSASTLGG